MSVYRSVWRRLSPWCACGVVAFGMTAKADVMTITGGNTSVALDSATVTTLTSAGVTLGLLGNASLSGLTATFPITGGSIDTAAMAATINHQGSGLSFTNAMGTLDLENFMVNVNLASSTGVLSGDAVFGGATAAGVPLFDIGSGLALTLTSEAAAALASDLGLPNLTGAPVGTASTSPVTSPEPANLGLTALALIAIGRFTLKSRAR